VVIGLVVDLDRDREGVLSVVEHNVFLIYVKFVLHGTFGVGVVVEAHSLLVEVVAVGHRGMDKIFCLCATHQVFSWAEVDELIVEVSGLSLNLVTINLCEPITGELLHNQGKVLLVLLFGVVQGLEVKEATDLVLSVDHHLIGDAAVVDCVLGVLVDVDAEPAHIAGSPHAFSDLFLEV